MVSVLSCPRNEKSFFRVCDDVGSVVIEGAVRTLSFRLKSTMKEPKDSIIRHTFHSVIFLISLIVLFFFSYNTNGLTPSSASFMHRRLHLHLYLKYGTTGLCAPQKLAPLATKHLIVRWGRLKRRKILAISEMVQSYTGPEWARSRNSAVCEERRNVR